jgi:cell division protein ZapA (FtsZ GTPase activity inhibitor)
MSGSEKILIQMAGQEFRIAPPGGDADRLRRMAAHVSEKVAAIEKAGVVASHRSALLAALEIAFELYEHRETEPALSETDLSEAQSRLDRVIGQIDEVLDDQT